MTAVVTAQEAPAATVTAHPNVVLEARDIVKDLGAGAGRVRALKGVSLSLNAGELTLLMGPSGSGKTTLLSILGCILTPTEGTLTIAGHSTAGLSAEALARLRRQNIGFIFQSYHLFPTLTAEENVRLALDVRGERGSDAVVYAQRALQQVGLRHKLKSYPAKLSGGDEKRKIVPYSSVYYDATGSAWVYVNPKPLTFERQRVDIERVEDNLAILTDGPSVGTSVVTVGAAMLYGAEIFGK